MHVHEKRRVVLCLIYGNINDDGHYSLRIWGTRGLPEFTGKSAMSFYIRGSNLNSL